MSGVELAKNLRAINRNYDLSAGVHFDIRKAAEYLEAAPDLAKEVERLREALTYIARYAGRTKTAVLDDQSKRVIAHIDEIARQALSQAKDQSNEQAD